jgi:hypothetical protein
MLCAAPVLAISPHTLSLAAVLRQADWVAVVRVLEVNEAGGNRGSGLNFKVQVVRVIDGTAPTSPANLLYWEAWPAQDPGGRVEAPIWTGSGLEDQLHVGDEFIAISSGLGLSRAEPLAAEAEVLRMLEELPSP